MIEQSFLKYLQTCGTCINTKVNDKKYKIQFTLQTVQGQVSICLRILKVLGTTLSIELQNQEGSTIDFHKLVKEIKLNFLD